MSDDIPFFQVALNLPHAGRVALRIAHHLPPSVKHGGASERTRATADELVALLFPFFELGENPSRDAAFQARDRAAALGRTLVHQIEEGQPEGVNPLVAGGRNHIAGPLAIAAATSGLTPSLGFDELRRDLKGDGVDYPHTALATASDADRHIAVLSRLPLRAVTTHTDLEFTYFGTKEGVKRGLVEATISTPAGDVTIFAIHLKSRFTERPDDPLSAVRRAGEATAIRDRVLRRFPAPANSRFVVLGDCNDSRSSRAAAALQKRGKTVITTLLPSLDSRGEAWTHVYRREESYTRVDLIFVSPALKAAVQEATARVYDGAGVREASDHRPVYVVLHVAAPP